MAADVDRRLDPSPALIAGLLACFGVAGVIGTIVTSKAAASMPPGRLLLVALGFMASGLLALALAPPQPIYYVIGFTIWGLAAFSVQPLQQGRLVAARPLLASATAALNSTAINLGQAIGGGLGAYVISIGRPGLLTWLAALLTIAAMGLSVLTDRKVAVVVLE